DRPPGDAQGELGDLLAELAVAQLDGGAERRRGAGPFCICDAHLRHAPERFDTGVQPPDLEAKSVPSRSASTAAGQGERRQAKHLRAHRNDVLREWSSPLAAQSYGGDPADVVLR